MYSDFRFQLVLTRWGIVILTVYAYDVWSKRCICIKRIIEQFLKHYVTILSYQYGNYIFVVYHRLALLPMSLHCILPGSITMTNANNKYPLNRSLMFSMFERKSFFVFSAVHIQQNCFEALVILVFLMSLFDATVGGG